MILTPKLHDSGRGRRLVYITAPTLLDIIKDFTREEDVPDNSAAVKFRYINNSRKLAIMLASPDLPPGTSTMRLDVDLQRGGLLPS